MDIDIKTIDNISIVELGNDINLYNASVFKAAINKLINENKILIILNFEKVSFIDSSGIGVLIQSFSELKKLGGSLKIFGLDEFVKKTFKMMNIIHILEIYDKEDDALKSFKNN